MTQTTSPVATPVVRLPETRNIERLIAQARRDRCTIILERSSARRDGSTRKTPVLEITPHGDVLEIPTATLRASVIDRLIETDLDFHAGLMNKCAAAGHARIAKLAIESRDYMNADAELRREYRQQQQHKRAARSNRNTTTLLNGRTAA